MIRNGISNCFIKFMLLFMHRKIYNSTEWGILLRMYPNITWRCLCAMFTLQAELNMNNWINDMIVKINLLRESTSMISKFRTMKRRTLQLCWIFVRVLVLLKHCQMIVSPADDAKAFAFWIFILAELIGTLLF